MHPVTTAEGIIRKLWVGEAEAYRDHLLRLDPDSRRNRFGGAVSDGVVRAYAEQALAADALIHGFFAGGLLCGAAELRPLLPRRLRQAEAAFSVEGPWQSRGVGSALLERTLLAARNRGFARLHLSCLPENQRMQQLALKYAARLTWKFGSVEGEVETARANPLSLMREWFADAESFATALVEAQSRLLKPSY